jgi:arylsulfatase A-like enzyme
LSRRSSAAAAAFLALAAACARDAAPAPADRAPAAPRGVLILADDLGWGDLGCTGGPHRTPHLDRLAAEGAFFTDFDVAQPVCSASRAALLTGCYPNRIGIHGALGPADRHGLHPDETTLAEALRARGYATALFGKWHLGCLPEFLPTRHGFDEFAGIPYSNDMAPRHPEGQAYPPLPFYEQERVTALDPDQDSFTLGFARRGADFVRRSAAAGRPFFLFLPQPMPHVPLHASAAFRGRSAAGLYGYVIEELDASVGLILAALAEAGVARETLVIFSSDNGPWLSYGAHAGSSGALREGKGTVFEGGVRVPLLMRWPARIPAGTVVREPAMAIDLFPTVLAFAAAPPPVLATDGRDLGPQLTGAAAPLAPEHPYFYWYGVHELQAVRAGRWKLHFPHGWRRIVAAAPEPRPGFPRPYDYAPRTGLELYDLASDPGETRDLAAARPEVVARLQAAADEMRARLGDALTGVAGAEVREPGRVP